MKENLTELVFILDKSGSMSGLESDTIGGFNSLLEKQKKEEGECIVSTVLFDHNDTVIHNRADIKSIKPLTDKEYVVGGSTALLDAVGNAVNHIIKVQKMENEENVPSKTMFIITTDGYENSSKEYSYNQIKNVIEKQKALGWEFIFLGANIDVITEGAKFGISEENSIKFNNSKEGIELNYMCLSKAVSSIRKARKVDKEWRKKIDESMENIDK